MSRTTIEELISQMDTIPFLFIGSGFSRRYYGLPDWNGLLKHMIKQICSDEFAFQSYVSKAKLKDKKYGLYPAIATVLEADFNKKWFEDPSIRCVDEYYMQKIKDGCSPFKAETAQFIKSNSVLKEIFRDEVKLFGHISKKSVAGIITTNYDMFFEKYLSGYKVFIGQNELLFSQLQGVAEVYKIHGSVLNPQSIVINENDYKEFKEHKEYLAAKLLTIFMEYPIVFIGYSLSDSNIIDILSSIVKCKDNDKLNKLKDKFIFVDYKENYKGYDIDDYTTTFQNGKMISMKKITLSDYSIIFNALAQKKMKLPVRILRHLKDELYEYVLTNQPNNSIKVASLDDDRVSNDELVLSIGTLDTSNVIGLKGLKGITTAQWFKNIVLDDLDFDDDTLLTAAPYLANQCSGKLPVNSLISTEEQKMQYDKLYTKDFDSILSNTIRKTKPRYQHLRSMQDVFDLKLNNKEKEFMYMAYLNEEQIDLKCLESYLCSVFEDDPDILENASPGTKTNLRRLIRIFDYLKGKN